jgi:hypothetical protein
MAHDASTFATSAKQWTSPAATAAAEAAAVAAAAASYASSADAAVTQYEERTA